MSRSSLVALPALACAARTTDALDFQAASVRPTPRARQEVMVRLRAMTADCGLSRRQSEILLLLIAGLSNKEIANSLSCSEVTVESHMTSLLRRTGSDTRAVLVAKFWLELDVG